MSGKKRSTDLLLGEWFWTDRWPASPLYELPIAERGLHREMRTAAWARGLKLPADHAAIQRVIGCSEREWRALWPKVAPHWRVEGDYLVNDELAATYAESKARQDAIVSKAKAAAAARWGAGPGPQGGGMPEQMPMQMPDDKPKHMREQMPTHMPVQCPPDPDQEEEQKEHTPPPLARRRTHVEDLPIPSFDIALAIAHHVIERYPADEGQWTAEFKATCLAQRLNYAGDSTEPRPLYVRALEAAAAAKAHRSSIVAKVRAGGRR